MLLEEIKNLSLRYAQENVASRRHLHSNPELSYQEYNTAKFVATKLKDFGLTPVEGVAGTGVVVLIEGKNPNKKTVALRADMDALPIQEANTVSYKSQNPGVMHACGHDVHTASLLGTAKILAEVKNKFDGSVKLIFQPGEEKNPGGASYMIRDGALKYTFWTHDMPELYDLRRDPKEMRNLALKPDYRSRVDELKAKLFAWYAPPEINLPAPR